MRLSQLRALIIPLAVGGGYVLVEGCGNEMPSGPAGGPVEGAADVHCTAADQPEDARDRAGRLRHRADPVRHARPLADPVPRLSHVPRSREHVAARPRGVLPERAMSARAFALSVAAALAACGTDASCPKD